jgi:hypothetical protein
MGVQDHLDLLPIRCFLLYLLDGLFKCKFTLSGLLLQQSQVDLTLFQLLDQAIVLSLFLGHVSPNFMKLAMEILTLILIEPGLFLSYMPISIR